MHYLFCVGDIKGHRSYSRNEPVTSPRDGFDESRVIGNIAQRMAKLLQCTVQTEIDINKSVGWPESLAEFFPCDHLTRTLQKDR
jgi:hypothetical protein